MACTYLHQMDPVVQDGRDGMGSSNKHDVIDWELSKSEGITQCFPMMIVSDVVHGVHNVAVGFIGYVVMNGVSGSIDNIGNHDDVITLTFISIFQPVEYRIARAPFAFDDGHDHEPIGRL